MSTELTDGNFESQAEDPTVTVAIPTYNRAALLPDAIESVLAQTFSDFELLILDDASTDETPTVARSYGDRRVRHIRNPKNIGMTANWNRGFELARGTYVSPLHDDDRWTDRFLERAVEVFSICPTAGFVYSAVSSELGLETKDRVFSQYEALDRLRRRNEVAEEAALVRRQALIEVGGFRDRWPFSMDWEVWLKIAARYPVGFLAESFGHKGTHGEDQFTARIGRTPLAVASDRLGMLRETIPDLPLSEDRRRKLLAAAMRSLAQAQLVTAWDYAARGERARARAEARFAFSIDKYVAVTSPHLAAATYLGLFLPPSLMRRLNTFRAAARPIFRRD